MKGVDFLLFSHNNDSPPPAESEGDEDTGKEGGVDALWKENQITVVNIRQTTGRKLDFNRPCAEIQSSVHGMCSEFSHPEKPIKTKIRRVGLPQLLISSSLSMTQDRATTQAMAGVLRD